MFLLLKKPTRNLIFILIVCTNKSNVQYTQIWFSATFAFLTTCLLHCTEENELEKIRLISVCLRCWFVYIKCVGGLSSSVHFVCLYNRWICVKHTKDLFIRLCIVLIYNGNITCSLVDRGYIWMGYIYNQNL